jgi:hypothetical protein
VFGAVDDFIATPDFDTPGTVIVFRCRSNQIEGPVKICVQNPVVCVTQFRPRMADATLDFRFLMY